MRAIASDFQKGSDSRVTPKVRAFNTFSADRLLVVTAEEEKAGVGPSPRLGLRRGLGGPRLWTKEIKMSRIHASRNFE